MTDTERWTPARANAWYDAQPWFVGCNFIPSTASNQLEMWQAATFDPETIDRELGWARGLGFNTLRVFLHDLLWEAEPQAFAARIDAFLAIAARQRLRTLFVLFDDCWHDGARLGQQAEPVPGRHNSRWLQSPGHAQVEEGGALPRLEAFVAGVVRAFGDDERVLGWDLYNEVGNRLPAAEDPRRAVRLPKHLELLDLAFGWARAARPSQPLTAGLWSGDREANQRLAANSDVISFHCYDSDERLLTLIGRLRRHGRPLLCTEYMARTRGSDFRAQLPIFKGERIGCYNWGLVNGRTQTHIAWTGEQDVWFHDILRRDGTPYDAGEAAFIRAITGASATM
jgi:hypothetical protein